MNDEETPNEENVVVDETIENGTTVDGSLVPDGTDGTDDSGSGFDETPVDEPSPDDGTDNEENEEDVVNEGGEGDVIDYGEPEPEPEPEPVLAEPPYSSTLMTRIDWSRGRVVEGKLVPLSSDDPEPGSALPVENTPTPEAPEGMIAVADGWEEFERSDGSGPAIRRVWRFDPYTPPPRVWTRLSIKRAFGDNWRLMEDKLREVGALIDFLSCDEIWEDDPLFGPMRTLAVSLFGEEEVERVLKVAEGGSRQEITSGSVE